MSLRTGAEYLAALQDDRAVWLGAEKVADITRHPRLGPFAHVLADIYDLQHDPACRDLLTVTSPSSGQPVSRAFLPPRSTDDLVRQREMFELLERRCGGVLGRFPQYMGAVLLGLYSLHKRFDALAPDFAGNVDSYVEYCRENDLCLTLGFHDPPRDRQLAAAAVEYLKVVESRPDGIVIRGAKSVATLAPYADEYLGLTPSRPDLAAENVLYFATPLNAPGVRVVCRESFTQDCPDDHPLSAFYDEMDACVLFEDVFIPRERVFLLDRVDANASIFGPIPSTWGYYYGLIRAAVKTEALAGVCFAVADYLGTRRSPAAEAVLAEVVAHLESLRTFIRAAEEHPVYDEEGLAKPHPSQILLGRILSLDQHQRMLEIVRDLCGSSILMAPSRLDLESSKIGPALRRFIGGSDPRALDRFRLMKLAWEYTSESFGSRQMLFEMYNASTLSVNRGRLLSSYDASPLVSLAQRLAGVQDS